MDSSAVSSRLIGSIFVEKGLITDEQLEEALELQRVSGERLGEILVEKYGVERLDLASALAEQWAEYERQGAVEDREAAAPDTPIVPIASHPVGFVKRPIGEIFVERGLVTESQLEEALAEQRRTGNRLGEILVSTGKLSRLELASALADQWATFQKLRPPDDPTPSPSPSADTVRPAPEVVAAPRPANGAASDLAERLEELQTRVDELAETSREGTPDPEAAVALTARLDQLEEQLGAAVPATDVRSEVDGLVAELRTRIEQLEAAATPPLSDESSELAARIDALTEQLATAAMPVDEWRAPLAELAARVDVRPAPTDEWRSALGDVEARLESLRAEHAMAADDMIQRLRERIDEIEQRSAGHSEDLAITTEVASRIEALSSRIDDLGSLRPQLDELAARSDSPPPASEAWRDEIAALAARLDALPVPSDEWRYAVDELRGRLDLLPAPSEEWREQLAALAARFDSLPAPSEEWREHLAAFAARLDSLPIASEEWRHEVHELRGRLDSLPAPSEEWRHEVDELRARLDSLPIPSDEWREHLAAFAARLDALPQPSDEWREQIAALAQRVDSVQLEDWKPVVAELSDAFGDRLARLEQRPEPGSSGGLEGLQGEVDDLKEALAESTQPLDALRSELAERVHEMASRAAGFEARLDDAYGRLDSFSELWARLDETERRAGAAEGAAGDTARRFDEMQHAHEEQVRQLYELSRPRVDEELVRRLAALDEGMTDLRSAIAARTGQLSERLEAVEERTAAISMHSAQEIELQRRELGELRVGISGATEAAEVRADERLEMVRAELAAALERTADTSREIRAALATSTERSDELTTALGALEQRLDEKAAAKTAELGALRARLENVEIALGQGRVDGEAFDSVLGRLDEQDERIDELVNAQARRKDVRELAHTVARLEHRVDARESVDKAATRAIEKAVRKGLAGLGERITVAEDAYLEAGKALQGSIEGLGRAIAGADAHLVETGDGEVEQPTDGTYVAFAPTPEGYRLVVCDGVAPDLGVRVELPVCEGALVVTRCGSSPLPFDARACVYLERA